jgi:hypothetical protein
MWLYRRKQQDKETGDKVTASDRVAEKIAAAAIKLQQLFAEKMNRLFMKTDFKRLKIILILFCICTGGYSIYLIANSVISADRKQNSFEVQQMDVPKYFDKTGDENLIPEAYVDEETYHQVKQFRNYMDSLKQKRRNEYDSILQARPGLMDSVQMLEQIYLSQKQK